LESIPGLLESLKIRAQVKPTCLLFEKNLWSSFVYCAAFKKKPIRPHAFSLNPTKEPTKKEPLSFVLHKSPEPVFLNVYGAQESIPRNEFRQPM
jgi:hypothetical protein